MEEEVDNNKNQKTLKQSTSLSLLNGQETKLPVNHMESLFICT
jgi:hypothetical protein